MATFVFVHGAWHGPWCWERVIPELAQNRTQWIDFEIARDSLYSDCDPADARAAFERLRPQGRAGYAEPCPLTALPDVPTTYVCCTEDALVNPAWGRAAPRERLGVDPVLLPGGHFPLLS